MKWCPWLWLLTFFLMILKSIRKPNLLIICFFLWTFCLLERIFFMDLKKIYIYRLFCSNQKKSWSSLLSSSSKLWRMRTARSPPMDVLSIRSTFLSFNYFLLFSTIYVLGNKDQKDGPTTPFINRKISIPESIFYKKKKISDNSNCFNRS